MAEPIKVGAAGDIEDEEALIVPADTAGWDDDIAVFFSDGKYYALNDTCSHEDASLGDGWIEGDEVECPIHSAKFSLCTGAALCLPASHPVRTHKVEIRNDEIWLYVGVPADGQEG
ncbi:non-heme iron oxygenase ferredoxin subunit [Granulicoccus phenolivorans]|uniref:non-heme iron oxygenase ferredoxin subunit n=1 Tax=Granulicoccus phenolivorans TaxID=266854 RepID=UPI00041A96E0|nr:non-heme iron oxygenase ferredoxin subunit [Granulicoccus phenolivorans]